MKNVFLVFIIVLMSSSFIQAQNNAVVAPLKKTSEVEKIGKEIKSTLGLVLTIDNTNKTANLEISNYESAYKRIETAEDKMKLKTTISALEELKNAESFLDVISASSGKMTLISHEISAQSNKEIHYFIFKF